MAAVRLTVVQVLPALESGGVERGTLEVAAALVAAGHRSIVISAGGRLVPALTSGGSEHVTLEVGRKSLLSLRLVPQLRRFLQAQRVDILHARSRLPAWLGWLAYRGMPPGQRPHFVTTVHGLYSVNVYSRIMTRGERVIAVSDTARNYVLEHYPGVAPDRVVTIRRGVDDKAFPYGYRPAAEWLQAWQAQYPQLQGCRLLTLPGRLTRLKGHDEFMTLIAALRARGHEVHGLIVGHLDPARQDYIDELRQRVASLGLQPHITFTGQRDDIRDIYAISTLVFSLSNRPESFGRTVLEPLRMGVPAVGYDHGGVGEILAALYPPGRVRLSDQAQLLSATERLLLQPQPVAASTAFSLQAMLDATLRVYSELAGAGAER